MKDFKGRTSISFSSSAGACTRFSACLGNAEIRERGEEGWMDRWKIWTEFNQFVRCRSKPCSRKSIATCYWNDPIHPGGFFIPGPSQPPRRYAQRYTATEIQYPTPGKNALGCHASWKFTDWSMSPDPHTVPPRFSTFQNHDTRFYAPVNPARELSTLFFPPPLFFSFFLSFLSFLLARSTFHPSRGGGRCYERSSIVGKSEEVFSRLMDISDKQRNPYRNIYIVKFLFRGYNFSSPLWGDRYCWKTIHRPMYPANICYLRFTMLINLLVDTFTFIIITQSHFDRNFSSSTGCFNCFLSFFLFQEWVKKFFFRRSNSSPIHRKKNLLKKWKKLRS